MCDIEALRLFVNERLTAVAEDILAVFVRTIVQYQQQIDLQHRQLEFLTPQVTSDLQDPFCLPVCEEEVSPEQRERMPVLLKEEPQPPQIKEELQELVHRPEEADGSVLTLLPAESEFNGNRETEHLASTSNEHVKTQAGAESRGASQPTADVQLLSSESDTEDSDEWEETREDQSLKSPGKTRAVERQRLSLRNNLSQALISVQQTPSMRAYTMERTFICTVCGKVFNRNGNLKRHTRTHTAKSEDSERETEPVASTSTEHMKTRADVGNCGASRPTGDLRILSPISCSESDTEEDSEEETWEDQSPKSHCKTRPVEGQRLSLRNKPSWDLISVQQTTSTRAHTMERTFSCKVCGRTFNRNGNLKRHTRTHRSVIR